MAEIFGGAAAALQIMEMLVRLGKAFAAAENLSNDITFFCINVTNMGRILPVLFTTAESSLEYLDRDEVPKRQLLLDGLVLQFEIVSTRIAELAKRIGLHDAPTDQNKSPLVYNWRVRIRWLLAKSDITSAQLMQETAKQSAQLFLTTMVCERLVSRIRDLEYQGGNKDTVRELKNRMACVEKDLGTQRRKLRSTRRRLEHFQEQHQELFPREDIVVFKKTEKAIVETTKVMVPENRRRTNGSTRPNSRKAQSTQARGQSPRPPRSGSPDRFTERPSRSMSRTSSLRPTASSFSVTTPPPRRPQPNQNRPISIIHTSGTVVEQKPTVEKSAKSVTGSRVRDDGVRVREEFGKWPAQVFSEEEKTRLEEPMSGPSKKRSGSGSSTIDGDRRPLSPSAQDPQAAWSRGQVAAESGKGGTRGIPGPGRWQPMPPFTGSDLSERRRRRSVQKSDDAR